MPEGPEVYIYAQALDSKCKGKRIENVFLYPDSKYKDESILIPIIGKKIRTVQHKGKKIIFAFTDGSFLISSLGMEGRWQVVKTLPESTRHLSISMNLSDVNILTYWDSRHFGDISFSPDRESLAKRLHNCVGPSWIPSPILFPDDIITKEDLFNSLQNPRIGGKEIMYYLMEQKYFSGVGNYIRAEVLYMAKISPYRAIRDITRQESNLLYDKIMYVMKKASEECGHSLRSYVDPEGSKGGYVPIVYGQEYTRDSKKYKVIREMDKQKRSIHWVPEVQV